MHLTKILGIFLVGVAMAKAAVIETFRGDDCEPHTSWGETNVWDNTCSAQHDHGFMSYRIKADNWRQDLYICTFHRNSCSFARTSCHPGKKSDHCYKTTRVDGASHAIGNFWTIASDAYEFGHDWPPGKGQDRYRM